MLRERRKSHHVSGSAAHGPSSRKCLAVTGVLLSFATASYQSSATRGCTGTPRFGGLDCRLTTRGRARTGHASSGLLSQASTAPGTVTAVDRIGRDLCQALLNQDFGAHRRTGAARSIIAPDRLAGLCATRQKQSPPMPVMCGSTDARDRHRRNGRISRIAAGAHHLYRGKRGQRMRGRDHAAAWHKPASGRARENLVSCQQRRNVPTISAAAAR